MNGTRFIPVARGSSSAPAAPFSRRWKISASSWSMKNTKPPTNRRKRRVIMRATSRWCERRSKSAVVLLGTATPSLESYHNTLTKKYQLASLTQRVDNCQMPLIRVVDLRQRTTEQARTDSFGKIAERDFRSARKTRADNSVSQSARIFDFVALQQLRRSARLSELQRRAHISSHDVAAELSSLRAHRGGAKEMSGVRPGRVDLRPALGPKRWNRPSRKFFRTRW